MKAIQILSYQSGIGDTTIVALCDDGTIWQKSPYMPFWEQMPEVRNGTQEEYAKLTERLLATVERGTKP